MCAASVEERTSETIFINRRQKLCVSEKDVRFVDFVAATKVSEQILFAECRAPQTLSRRSFARRLCVPRSLPGMPFGCSTGCPARSGWPEGFIYDSCPGALPGCVSMWHFQRGEWGAVAAPILLCRKVPQGRVYGDAGSVAGEAVGSGSSSSSGFGRIMSSVPEREVARNEHALFSPCQPKRTTAVSPTDLGEQAASASYSEDTAFISNPADCCVARVQLSGSRMKTACFSHTLARPT